jgi:bifunctional DNA-binding transcriptional regulator/antitoxin component of YhaV-PrlF toxin-antitoxin module
MSIIEMERYKMKSKRISVSGKRQITIPIEYCKALNIGDEVECVMKDNTIIIKAVLENNSEFSEFILKDLIDEGYSGEELLEKFKERKSKVRPAIKKLIEEADRVAEE